MTAQPPKSSTSSTASTNLKFLCSYGGKILPRPSDGKLRYVGGHTRVLSVDRSISFSELTTKLDDLCGFSATLRCQLPDEDMDVLVTIKSVEDLVNLIDEYDRASSISARDLKIRAILYPKSPKLASSRSPLSSASSASSVDSSPKISPSTRRSAGSGSSTPNFATYRRVAPPTAGLTACSKCVAVTKGHNPCNSLGQHTVFFVPHSNYSRY